VNPAVATGKPCIRDLRFAVSRLLGLLASGETRESIPTKREKNDYEEYIANQT